MRNKKQLTDAKAFLEGMGEGAQGEESSSSKVKIENAHFLHMNQAKDGLKLGP